MQRVIDFIEVDESAKELPQLTLSARAVFMAQGAATMLSGIMSSPNFTPAEMPRTLPRVMDTAREICDHVERWIIAEHKARSK